MRAAAPLASSFVIGLLSFFSSAAFFKKAGDFRSRSRYALFYLCVACGAAFGAVSLVRSALPAAADLPGERALRPLELPAAQEKPALADGPNEPMGKGVGIKAGRVVWVHDPRATNEKYANRGPWLWYDEWNAKQAVVDAMLETGIRSLTGAEGTAEAWDALFRSCNKRRGRGDTGYRTGETIVIKINENGLGNGRQNIDTSPQVLHALLDQLVNAAGVSQDRIILGEPNIDLDRSIYRTVLKDFPRVRYMKRAAGEKTTEPTAEDVLFASDGGTSDPLPRSYVDAAYLINVPVLKKHHRAGISLTAKLHFGSVTPYNGNGAFNWHYGLPAPMGGADVTNGGYGRYRCLVDFMGHRDLGGKTVLYLVDGLWGSTNWGHPAVKWRMEPFNGDYPSSLFLSEDPVAVDSVGYDFLRAEFDETHPTEGAYDPRDEGGPFPQYPGVDDYLHQAADIRNRPVGLVYDPERDGIPLVDSLGVHEHWSDGGAKRYGRNLGRSEGIELVYSGPSSETLASLSPLPGSAAPGASSAAPEPRAGATEPTGSAGKVYGEFQDRALFERFVAGHPEMKGWSERAVWDGLSGATIQAKTMGRPVPARLVLLGNRVIAAADGFGQFWVSLPPGRYVLTGRCAGYEDAEVEVEVTAVSATYANFYLKKKPRFGFPLFSFSSSDGSR